MAGLNFPIGANITAFESGMSRVRDIAAKRASEMTTNFEGAAKAIDRAFTGLTTLRNLPVTLNNAKVAAIGLAATAAGILGAYALVTSALDQANAQLERFIALGANAERSGISVEFFQRFSEAAKDAKLQVSEIEAALKKAGEAVTPKFDQDDAVKKRLNEVFESGYLGDFQSKGLADYRKSDNNEDRIRATVTAMQELEQIGERLAAIDLAERLFGTETAERIRSGRLQIDAIATALDRQRDDLITQQEVDAAAEFRARLDEAYKTIDEFLHVSVALEGSGRALQEVWLGIAEGVARATVNAGNFYNKIQEMQGPLANYLKTVGLIVAGTAQIFSEGFNDQAAGSRTIYSKPIGPEQPGAPPNAIVDAPTPPRRPLSVVLEENNRTPSAPKAATPATETLNQVESYINSLERTTAALKAEMEAFGKTNAERLTAINLAKAEELAKQNNLTLSAAEIARIKETSAATAEYRDRLEEVRERHEAIRDMGGTVLRGIVSDIRAGVSGMQLLTNAASRFLDKLIEVGEQGLIDSLFGKSGGTSGSGLLGSVFSSLLGGGAGLGSGGPDLSVGSDASFLFDSGGYTGPGGKHEPGGIVHKGEIVFSQDDIRRNGGVRNVERMRRATQGYAAGGYVAAGGSVPSPASPAVLKVVPVMPAAPAQKPAPMSGPISIGGTMLSITQPGASIQEIRLLLEDHDRALPAKMRDIQRRAGA